MLTLGKDEFPSCCFHGARQLSRIPPVALILEAELLVGDLQIYCAGLRNPEQ